MFSMSRNDLKPAYTCGTYHRRGLAGCTSHHIRVDKLDELLKKYVRKVKECSAEMLAKLNEDLRQEESNVVETEQSADHLAEILEDLREELKATKRQRIRDILKHPDQESLLEETYDELESDLQKRMEGLTHQIDLLSDKRNTIIQVNRAAKTAMDVFDDILNKEKLERNDLELLVDEIRVFEDRLELKLQPDVDSILQCSTMERTINFPDGTGDISSISIVQSAKQRPDKVFRANVINNGSPSRIRMVRRISLGMTTRPRSSIRRTIPVAFIYEIPPVKANFTSVVSAPREMNMHEVPLTIFCRQSTACGIAAIKRPPVIRPEVLHIFAFLQSAYFTARPAYPPAACAPASEWRRPP